MIKTRSEQFKTRFERTYGADSWTKFRKMIKQEVRPQVVEAAFISVKTEKEMGKAAYYKWEARAREGIK